MLFSPNCGILSPQLSRPPLPPPVSMGNDETLLHYDNLISQYNCLLHDNHTAPVGGPSTTLLLEKRDGHSKIFTAQGPRDRRIRLSKEVARKFFDLQDLLGFDRASKTLDWLLKKSKPAIKELMMPLPISTPRFCSLMYPSSESENLESSKNKSNTNISTTTPGVAKKKTRKRRNNIYPSTAITGRKPKLVEAKLNLDDQLIMKEMRAKARARARERTMEKKFLREMMIINNQVESCHKTSTTTSSSYDQKEDYLQQNLIISTESSSNFFHWSPNSTTTDNWDINAAVVTSSSSSSFLQYPFTNFSSSSSSPAGTVLQVQSKPFDLSEYNSNNNHGLMWS